MEPAVGIEPTTFALRKQNSTCATTPQTRTNAARIKAIIAVHSKLTKRPFHAQFRTFVVTRCDTESRFAFKSIARGRDSVFGVQASRVTVVCDTGLDGAAAWLAWRVAGILFAGGTLCRADDSRDQSGCNRILARRLGLVVLCPYSNVSQRT